MAPIRSTAHPGNLPVELTSFVGRRQESGDLKRIMATARLVTLTGPGGVGKTKLALRAARETLRQYRDGAWLIELAAVDDPARVTQAVFAALGLQDRLPTPSIASLTGYLADKRLLLVLDNAEHVLDAVAALVGALLRDCPEVRLLVTSRQALGIVGEIVIDVPALSLPEDADPPVEAIARSDAVALFVERASAAQRGFALDAANAPSVHRIVARLDGIPLALELAAVRVPAFGLAGLDEGLRDRLTILRTGDRSATPRQRTMDAAIEWSFRLLDPDERLLWMRLSVFVGGFELDAARAVCTDEQLPEGEIAPLLAALVERSVVKRRDGPRGGRYRLLEPLRAFGLERHREVDSDRSLRVRHRDWVAQIAAAAGANDEGQIAAFDRLRIERGNVWSALEFCIREPGEVSAGAEICRNLWVYWVAQGPSSEARRVLSSLLTIAAPATRSRAILLWVSAFFASEQADLARAEAMATEALDIGRSLGDADVVVWALLGRGVVAYLGQQPAVQNAYAQESLAIARTMGWRFATLCGTMLLALGHGQEGLDEGIAIANEGIALSEELGERWCRGLLFQLLATVLTHRGKLDEAEQHARTSLALRNDLDDLVGIALSTERLASIASGRGAHVRSATLLGAAEAMWRSVPAPIVAPARSDHDRAAADARAALSSARFEVAHRAGLSMTRQEAVDYGLEVRTPAARRPTTEALSTDGLLSRREMEVAELVADGASNAQVAARLFISERTVESHLANIFNKLGVDSRLQVARWIASIPVIDPV